EPILAEFEHLVADTERDAPRIPYISNLTGTWISDDEVRNAQTWTEHLRRTVRFADGLDTLISGPPAALVEIGPGSALARLAQRHAGMTPRHLAVSLMPHPSSAGNGHRTLLGGLARLWERGAPVEWSTLRGSGRRRIVLPTYPFERERYWIEASAAPD